MDLFKYPAVGFHFAVAFEIFPQTPTDFNFQEVSGLTVDVEMEPIREGGENRFVHMLPTKTKYTDITLKRGIMGPSGVLDWVKDSINNFVFTPVNFTVALMNADHIPLNAIPKKWDISSFNAERSEVVIETLTFSYNYFKKII